MIKKSNMKYLLKEEIVEDNRRLLKPKEIYICQGFIYTLYYLDIGISSIFDPTHKLYKKLSYGSEAIDRYMDACE